MYRRQVLASAGVALSSASAGCLEGVFGPSAGRRVALTAVGTVGGEHPLRLAASLIRRAMGPEGAPEVEITLRSTSDEALFLGYAESWPADGLLPERDSRPAGLRLLATSELADFTVSGGDCPHTAFRPVGEPSRGGHRVAPGAEVRVAYRVLGADQALAGACPEPGRYRWRSTYPYAQATAVERDGFEGAEQRAFDWGFTIEVPAAD